MLQHKQESTPIRYKMQVQRILKMQTYCVETLPLSLRFRLQT